MGRKPLTHQHFDIKQYQREPVEPLPPVETPQSDGARGPDASGVGNHNRGRVSRPAGLPGHARPDLVGITAFTSQANRAYEVAVYFRHLGVPVVMGGNLSYRSNLRVDCQAYANFKRQRRDSFRHHPNATTNPGLPEDTANPSGHSHGGTNADGAKPN